MSCCWLARALQVAQRERRGVVERLPGGLAERRVLIGDAGLVERRLHVEHGLLGRLQHGVQPAQDGHRQDDVAVLAADVDVAQHVVGDAPDEADDLVVCSLVHAIVPDVSINRPSPYIKRVDFYLRLDLGLQFLDGHPEVLVDSDLLSDHLEADRQARTSPLIPGPGSIPDVRRRRCRNVPATRLT